MTSLASRCGFRRARPAPLVPLAATTTTSAGLDQPGGDQRREGQDRRDGVAAGVGDPAARADRPGAGQLGQAVGPGAGVRPAVVALPRGGVGEPEVGAEVDDREVGGQLGHQRGRLAVRQGEEDHVGAARARPSVAAKTRSASCGRCGCTSVTGWPAEVPAAEAPSSRSGCCSSRRSSSPPA